MAVELHTGRFVLRELTVADATDRYLSWFGDSEAVRHIVAASQTKKLADLRHYIEERAGRADILFLGVFDTRSGVHIGNIKYEPVNSEKQYAVMGILIGDAAYRGKGVAAEVLRATAAWLREERGIRQIVLGVEEDHPAAIRAYESVGFAVESTPHIPGNHPGVLSMVWRL